MPSEQETSGDGDRQRGSTPTPSAIAPPPDGGYGWVCVLACFLVNGFTWGITASYGVYLSYYLSNALFPSSTPLSYAFIGGLNFSAAMLPSPLITLLTRVYGKHATMSLGILFQALGYSLASISTRLWHLYLSQGVLVGLGTGFLYIPSTAILSQWFERKRSLANGIAAAGSGVGGAAFAWGTGAMIASLGVGWALRVTAIIGFVANSVATLMMRDRNKAIQPPQLALDGRLLRRLDVWLLLGWAFVSMLGYIVLLFSLADFARAIGLSSGQATTIVGLLNVGTAVGRPVIGIWSDRFRRVDVAAILTAVNGVACFAFWLPARGFGLTTFFALFVGGILGVFWMTIGPLCAELVGLKDMPSLLSVSWLTVVLPSTFSEVIGLELRRENARFPYLYTQIYAGVTYLVAAVLMTALAVLKRRQNSKATNFLVAAVEQK